MPGPSDFPYNSGEIQTMVNKRFRRIASAIGLAALGGILLVACGDDGNAAGPGEPAATSSPTTAAERSDTGCPGDVGQAVDPAAAARFETCSGFLDLEDLRKVAGRTDISLAPPNVNSGPVEPNDAGLTTLCVIEYITPEVLIGGATQLRVSGPSITLNATAYDSAKNAEVYYRVGLQSVEGMREYIGSDWDVIEGVLGVNSHLLRVDAQGVGSIVGFAHGPYLIGLTTTLPMDASPLVTSEELQSLASSVRANLSDGG